MNHFVAIVIAVHSGVCRRTADDSGVTQSVVHGSDTASWRRAFIAIAADLQLVNYKAKTVELDETRTGRLLTGHSLAEAVLKW